MLPLPRAFDRQGGIFTVAQAAEYGWTRSRVRRAARRGDIVQLRAGVYRVADLDHLDAYARARWEHAAPAVGAVLATPGAQASHSTAAVLRDLPLAFVPDRACVSVVPWHTGEIAQVHVHRTTDERHLRDVVCGVATTTAARCCIDLAREHGVHAGVVPLDHALRHRLTTPDELCRTLLHCRRWPGVRAAREAVAQADPRSESVLESLSRLRLHASGLPRPALQKRIARADGGFVGRVDFYWDEEGVVGEADGLAKYDLRPQGSEHPWAAERRREQRLRDLGLIVVRWMWDDLRHFEEVKARLARALREGAARHESDRRWVTLPDLPPL